MRIFVLLYPLLVIAVCGCSTYSDEMGAMRDNYTSKSYTKALEALKKSGLGESQRNRFLYRVERAMILDRMGQLAQSRKLLLEADKIADELYTLSLTKTAATMLVNESVSDYSGEDYEKVAIHSILALSFLEEGKLESAQVEARKINTKLAEITANYTSKHANYREDAFARYLSGLIFEALGRTDDAIIAYRKALAQMTRHPYRNYYVGALSPALVKALYKLAVQRNRTKIIAELTKNYPSLVADYKRHLAATPGGGELVVIHEAGNIEPKRAMEFVLPISNQVVRFSFPVIKETTIVGRNQSNGVKVANSFYHASNLANMNAIAHQALEDRRGRIIAKGLGRLLIKGQITRQAEENFGVLGWLAGNLYGAVTETADTRSWTLLPQAFFVSRLRLAPGKHTVRIRTAGRIDKIIAVDIKAGELQIIRSKS